MPKYARFLKDIRTNKRKLEELSHVTLNEECLVVLQNKLPKKMRDPESFTIPCLISILSVCNVLADLGASINLIPYAVFEKPKPTRMSVHLADRSVKLTLRVDDEEVTFDIGRSMQHTKNQDALYFIETFYSCVSDHLHDTVEEESLGTQIVGGETLDLVGEDQFEE
ncbi:hypothetical protein L1987_22206 [Smallanthus sonchifolius]|uniref:Uncharacterized protein n=1 Tax=Smallanthus sonchifolius TaxID=185202 RepID=A0ACB9IGV5_9ASTR|nr:hypothetical protein L1987_22206 [Smallanthus sonchifolius]